MTKEKMIELVNSIKNVVTERGKIFRLGKELGLNFKPTKCHKCLTDYTLIIKEQLGIIDNAAEESKFNAE